MQKIFVIPAPDRTVRDPKDMQPIPAEGKMVTRSVYWDRRILSGDVLSGNQPQPKPETTSKPKRRGSDRSNEQATIQRSEIQ